MTQLHDIDRPYTCKYTNSETDEFMVFCILDTATTYEQVCKAFNALKKKGLTTRKGLKNAKKGEVLFTLKKCGYRWANQKNKYLKEFANNDIDLQTADRKEIIKSVKGVGMKLASMFLRNTRGHQYAVLDVHTLRWLQRNYKFNDEQMKKMSYEEKEIHFIRAAEFLNKDPMELDLEIWNKERVGNRKNMR